MGKVLGAGNTDVLNASIFQSAFCDWAEGHQLSCMEEVRVSGQNRFQVMDSMKPFITNPVISINRKFTDLYSIPNVTNYIMFTNHEDALAISNDDRRYCVLRCTPSKEEVARRNLDGYFMALFGALYASPGAFRHVLLTHQISSSFAATGHAPYTDCREFMSYLSKSDVEVAIEEIIEEASTPLVEKDILSSTVLSHLLATDKGLGLVPNRALSHALINLGYTRREGCRTKIGSTLHTLWYHPSLVSHAVEPVFLLRSELY